MILQEFEPLFQKITDKYPNHFQTEEQTAREFSDWFQTFERHPAKLVTDSFNYYLTHLAGPFHPEKPIILNCLNRIWKHKQQTQEHSVSGQRDAGDLKLARALSNVRDEFKSGKREPCYTKRQQQSRPLETRNILNIAEVFARCFVVNYLEPAGAFERQRRLTEEDRVDRPASDLTQGRYCYYCGGKTYRPNLGKTEASVKIADYFVCDKCDVKFLIADTSTDSDDLPF